MSFETPIFTPAIPEIFVMSAGSLVLAIDAFLPDHRRVWTYHLSQVTLVLAAVLCLALYPVTRELTFSNTFVSDGMSAVMKVFILLVTFVAFLYSRDYLRARNLFKGEYYVLGLFAALGMMVLVSAHSLLTVYLGLELLSLCLYAMVALHRDSFIACEAAMKFFVLGALASGMLLYGMSMLYGTTGTLDLAEIHSFVAQHSDRNLILVLALVFIMVGIAFKLGAVPFHMWIPDVYQGAPTPVTLFIGSAPKLAAFAMLIRLLVDGMLGLQADWTEMLIVLAVLSMAIGNIVAIAQTNLKRMLAYSTIAHVGFMLLGVIAGSQAGYASSMFYIVVYALMAMGGFGMIILLSRAEFEADELDDFKGLNERSPWYAFMMLIVMMSMAGIPPFVGFWAKWAVLVALVDSGTVWLAAVALAFAVVGLYYYLRVVWLMYFEKPEQSLAITPPTDLRLMLSVNALAVLGLGLYPGALMTLCINVFNV